MRIVNRIDGEYLYNAEGKRVAQVVEVRFRTHERTVGQGLYEPAPGPFTLHCVGIGDLRYDEGTDLLVMDGVP